MGNLSRIKGGWSKVLYVLLVVQVGRSDWRISSKVEVCI